MAEEKCGSGWIKAGVTSVVGLLSGAVLMYISPLVNSVIKPAKPVPNFAEQSQGLTVTFQNHSKGGTEGWWDFGDGSALEPFNANQETIVHTYPRPGSYTTKLSLRNFIGEETERSVAVNLDGNAANPPVIQAFEVIPQGPEIAPATYKIVSRVKNADLTICYLGDDRPLDINNESASQDRFVTLKEPGSYKLRLIAVSGKQSVEQTVDKWVGVGDFNAPAATLQVTYTAVRVEKVQKEMTVSTAFPSDRKESTYSFKEEKRVEAGFQIVKADFARAVKDSAVKNAKIEISADKTKFVVSGELTKPSGFWNKNTAPPSWATTVVVSMERRSAPQQKTCDPMTANLAIPGSVTLPMPPLPAGWEAQSRTVRLEVRDGGKLVLNAAKLPSVTNVQLKNRTCRVTAIEQGGALRLDVLDGAKIVQTSGK